MKRTFIILLVGLTTSVGVGARSQSTIDWKAIEAETLQHFRALVQIDTSNPPETKPAPSST